MGSPTIFKGARTGLLSSKGLSLKDGSIVDNDGVPNLIKNGHAEIDTTGWATYIDADQATPVDGTGPTANITWTRTTTTPLTGAASFLFTKDTSNRRGQGVSYTFNVDPAYRARVMNIQFDYIFTSINGSFDTSNPNLTVYIYDVTNATVIQPSSFGLLSNSQTIADKFQASFQTSATGSQYRLIFHVATVSTSGYTIEFDNIQVTPTEYAFGTPVTDWQSFTPTGSLTTNTTYTGKYRRIGDSAEIVWQLSFSGDPGTYSTVTVNLPSGMTIDTNKIPSTTLYELGDGFSRRAGDLWNAKLLYSSTTALSVFSMRSRTASTSGVDLANTSDTFPAADFVNGDYAYYKAIIPILGWSSSVQMSDQTSTRVIAARAAFAATSIPTQATEGSETRIEFASVIYDTSGSLTITSNSKFTAPTSGFYNFFGFTGEMNLANANATIIKLFKNGVAEQNRVMRVAAWAADTGYNFSGIVYLNAGDYVDIRVFQNSGGSRSFANGSFNIERISGPNQIAATEQIVARYTKSDASAYNGGAVRIFGNKVADTHGAYNTSTGLFTAPIAGFYHIDAAVQAASASYVAGGNARLYFSVAGSTVWGAEHISEASFTGPKMLTASQTVYLLAGQTLGVVTDSSPTVNFAADATRNSLAIFLVK